MSNLNQKAPHEVWFNDECLAKTADHELALVAFQRAFKNLMENITDPITEDVEHKSDCAIIKDLEANAFMKFTVETGKLDEA